MKLVSLAFEINIVFCVLKSVISHAYIKYVGAFS